MSAADDLPERVLVMSHSQADARKLVKAIVGEVTRPVPRMWVAACPNTALMGHQFDVMVMSPTVNQNEARLVGLCRLQDDGEVWTLDEVLS